MKKVKIIVITTTNGIKFEIGIDKSVASVINEINSCKEDYYSIVDSCAIRKSEIVSVEKFEAEIGEGDSDD